MKKNTNMTYMDTVHRDGTIWNLSMMVLLLLFPIMVWILFEDAAPDWKGVALGLLGTAPIMNVSPFSCSEFIHRGGHIPAPMHSLKN